MPDEDRNTGTAEFKAVVREVLHLGRREAATPRPKEREGDPVSGARDTSDADARTTRALSCALAAEDGIDAVDLDVHVHAGVATLSGTVDHSWMKERIEGIARACDGVADIDSRIGVAASTPGAEASDAFDGGDFGDTPHSRADPSLAPPSPYRSPDALGSVAAGSASDAGLPAAESGTTADSSAAPSIRDRTPSR